MRKITDYLKDNTINVGKVETTGVTPMEMQDVVFEDVLAYNIGDRFDSSRGKIDPDYLNGCLKFNIDADIDDYLDSLTSNYQLPHKTYRGAGAFIYPHIHWRQDDASYYSDWKVEYRLLNGGVIGAWTEQDKATYLGNRKPHPGGAGEFVQIFSFAPIDISGMDLSSIVQVRVWRDTVSAGNLDNIPLGASVRVFFIDAHVPLMYQGSKDEIVQ